MTRTVEEPRRSWLRPPAWLGWLTAAIAGCLLLVLGSAPAKFTPLAAPTGTVELIVTDEHGEPLEGATVAFAAGSVRTDRSGFVSVELERPASVVVSSPGFLDEPVAVGPTDDHLDIRLWAEVDEVGRERTSLHFGGDVMLGRRYLDPDRSTPYVHDAESARRVVAELSSMAAAADATVVNFESVIGEAPVEDALAAKRFLIQSTPLVTETLHELGVDLVTLGNNHAYDWGEAGLRTTLDALDGAGIAHVGAGFDLDSATRGRIVDASGLRLGIVSTTTVTGDFVNDRLPPPDLEPPANLVADDAWQYEERLFGLRPATDADRTIEDTQVALRPIRVSEAWEIAQAAEAHLPTDDATAAWRLVRSAFPELQDWVARRGHGGAAPYSAARVAEEVQRLRRAGADFVVVQFHGGFQFAPVESEFMRTASRRAIDDGADAVVSHHPHVLQGVEWYEGRLIVYSLGNLVFDQDFHATFPSALLRVVTDGERIVEARLLPIVLDRYRPTPLTGAAARDVVSMVAARSALAATSTRHGEHVRAVLDDEPDGSPVRVRFERNSGLIEPERPDEERRTVDLDSGEPTVLRPCSLVRSDHLGSGVQIGQDLLQWGTFDRRTTDARRTFPMGWLVPEDHRRWNTVAGTTDEVGDVAIELSTAPNETTALRVAALLDVPAHRIFDASGRPLDAPADYEIRLRMRRERGEMPIARLTTYARRDTDPTRDPETERLDQIELELDVPDDGAWHEVSVPVPSTLLDDDISIARALGLTIVLPPAHAGNAVVDDVEVVEWRGRTDAEQPVWVPASRIRGDATLGPRRSELTVRSC